MTYIKICGIQNETDALAAAAAGADFIGFVLASSPRQVTPDLAARIIAALKNNKAKAMSVGVFVNLLVPSVKKIAAACHLDWVQLSGDEDWQYCRSLNLPLINVIKCNNHFNQDVISRQINEGRKMMGENRYMVLLDTASKDKYGGTGETFDWNLAKSIVKDHQIIIAGGLNPQNVGQAIKTLKPWGVDVSTGVETNGIKDMKKIVAFIKAVREADASQA